MKQLAIVLVALGLAASHVSAQPSDLLARFVGGIGAITVAGVVGPANADGSFPNVKVNIVRGVMPVGGPWRIDDLKGDVTKDGRIKVIGTGLLLANGDKIGQNANLTVFATLFCGTAAPFSEHNSSSTGVALDLNGDFRIDDQLDSVPASCPNPALLIRSVAGSHAWFAAGIPDLSIN